MLGEQFEAFVQATPVAVMMSATLERTFAPERLEAVFEAHATKGYTQQLAFAACVRLMGDVVFGAARSVSAYLEAHLTRLGVSRAAVYAKLNRLEPAVGAGLVTHTAYDLRAVLEAMPQAPAPILAGWRVRILDGNHLAGTQHRPRAVRRSRSAALPGQALVFYDPRLDLIESVIPCEDAYANERALLPRALARVEPGDCVVDDRNFCTVEALFTLARRPAAFVTRQHANLPYAPLGPPKEAGVDARRRTVYEQPVRVTDPGTGAVLDLRRITVALETPSRRGDSDLAVVTNLPAEAEPAGAGAVTVLDLYGGRWSVETAFGRLTADLRSEIDTLAYPRAALFGFCVAAAAYNAVAAVKGAVRAAHGAKVVEEDLSSYYLADEVARVTPGMRVVLPEAQWAFCCTLPPERFAARLVDLAGHMDLRKYKKHKRGPKKPPPKKTSGKNRPHVSTARMLNQQNSSKRKRP